MESLCNLRDRVQMFHVEHWYANAQNNCDEAIPTLGLTAFPNVAMVPPTLLVNERTRTALDRVYGEYRGRLHSRNRGDWDMGINGWRNLGVLLLAGAALAGCNNTPTRDRSIITPKAGDSPIGINQQNKGPFNQPGQTVGTGNPSAAFPTNPNANSLQPAQGQGLPNANLPLNQNSQPLNVGANPGRFPPDTSIPTNNVQQPNNSFGPPSNPFGQQVPSVPSQFGQGQSRITQPGVPDTSNINIPPPPAFGKQP